jgi:hypothetical protein
MKIACYFAAAKNGAHPECSLEDYDRIWPVMMENVARHGYDLIHLTSLHDKPRARTVARIDVNPETVMLSREIAWLRFLEQLPHGEQAVLIEPDCVLRKPIPPLLAGKDALLLKRPGRPMPSGFRIATRRAIPFYKAVVDLYRWATPQKQTFHGDIDCTAKVLGIDRDCVRYLPSHWKTVHFEHRDWIDYTSKLWKKAVAWNFKGTSKHIMLDMALGIEPALR